MLRFASSEPPRWLTPVLALIPVVPPLYLLAFGALGRLRTLNKVARWMLLAFVLSQVLAALLSPNPLVSVVATAARTLFILAMVAAGVYLQDSRRLLPLLWGELVIMVSAWAYTLHTQGLHGVLERLGHPYYYVVSLGLVGVVSIWLALFWRGGARWWRWLAGLAGLATLLASGSRGPLLALVMGTGVAVALTGRKQVRNGLLLGLVLLGGLVYVASRPNVPSNPVGRFLERQVSGRNYVWQDAYAGFQTSPMGGVGPYQGGPYLNYLFKDGCHLNPSLDRNNIQCPEQMTKLYGIWLIAHNAWLHWLLETGIIGTLGMTALYLYGLYCAYRRRDPLCLAILFGYTAINMVDVLIAVPTPHLAELFWAALGLSIAPANPAALAKDAKATLPIHTPVPLNPR